MSKLRYSDVSAKPQEFMALTSLTITEFELLVPAFEHAFQAHMSQWRLDGQARTKRRYTTYQNCPLPMAADRLLFVLSYVKNNPLQSNHGLLFGMSQGKTNVWLHVLLPVLRASLRNLGVAPARSVRELAARLGLAMPGESAEAGPLPLFVMTGQNGASSAPKMPLHRKRAIAARKEPIP
jgi:hypothetical protein